MTSLGVSKLSEGIWIAIITSVLSLAGVIATSIGNRKKLQSDFQTQSQLADAKLEKNLAVMATRMDTLTDEVRKHNGFAEKIPGIQANMSNMERRISHLEMLGG